MATPCPQCGHRNRDGALICSHCSARLGAEPTASTSFGALGAARAAPVSPLDDLRVEPDAAPLHRATRDTPDRRASRERRERGEGGDARTGWIVAALSFFGVLAAAGAYWWTTEQGPTQTPVRDAAAGAPAAPAPAPVADAATPPAPVAQMPPASPPAPAIDPSPVPAPARPSAPVPTSRVATAAPAVPRAEPEAQRRPAVPERPRRAPAGEGAATPSRLAPPTPDTEAAPWAPPGREATNTSAPNYSDAGPPVVAGPGPRYQTMRPTAADPNAPAVPAVVGGDPGPPRAAGPGPRYDYGSPGARARP